MAKGKTTCKILKELRRRIAEANDINLLIEECTYKGDCLGTCPKCEAEVRYLEHQLQLRRATGKFVSLAGLSAGLIMLGCTSSVTKSTKSAIDKNYNPIEKSDSSGIDYIMTVPVQEDDVLEGEVSRYDREQMHSESQDKEKEVFGPDHIYDSAEKAPKFPGGSTMLLKFIDDNVRIPDSLDVNFYSCRVVVRFAIMKDGSIGETTIFRSKGEKFDQEAIAVVKKLPKFIPGEIDGKPVNVWYTLPVTFKRK